MKKLLAMLLALVMALSLVACGEKKDDTQGNGDGDATAAKVKVGFFSYSASGNRGIGAGLEVIQKIRDGERLSGGNNLDGFEVLTDEDDEFLN